MTLELLNTIIVLILLPFAILTALGLASVRKRQKHQERLLKEFLQQHIKKDFEALKASSKHQSIHLKALTKRFGADNTHPAATQTDLQRVHAHLAAQISTAGETLDEKISAHARGAKGHQAPLSITSSGEDLPGTGDVVLDRIEAEFSVIRRGINSEPSRFLNLVHGIPKAGNSSLLKSLWASTEIVGGALSAHFLSGEAETFARQHLAGDLKDHARHEFQRRLVTREFLGELGYLDDWNKASGTPSEELPLKVICPFRDPVASAQSLRFYIHAMKPFGKVTENVQPLISGTAEDPASFVEWMARWAEVELKGVHGLDLFEAGFDSERGFSVYKLPLKHVLVITLEAFGQLPDAIGELYDSDPGHWVNEVANTAAARPDAEAYRSAVDAFQLTGDEADRVYGAPIMRLLYSRDQLAAFKAKWARP